MIFYLDFEATQPENEIIAIGAVAENGATFHSLVKPRFSSISNFISQMTHISREDLENASVIDVVLKEFDRWLMLQEPNIMNCRFISYGDDKKFLEATKPAVLTSTAFYIYAVLLAKIENCLPEARNFFKGSIRLIDAYNYIQSLTNKQDHNPLKDAMMLKDVYNYMRNNEPLNAHPLSKASKTIEEVKMPSGTFWCQHKDGGKNIRYFDNFDKVVEWLVPNIMHADINVVRKDKIMVNIMRAIRKESLYCGYKWGRVKEEEKVET
jgi:DNA polymerase III epsilon subunit-like protein